MNGASIPLRWVPLNLPCAYRRTCVAVAIRAGAPTPSYRLKRTNNNTRHPGRSAKSCRHPDRRRRTLPPQWRDPRISPLLLPVLFHPTHNIRHSGVARISVFIFVCHSERSEESPHFLFGGSMGIHGLRKSSCVCLPEGAGGFSPLNKPRRIKGLQPRAFFFPSHPQKPQ